MRAFRAFAFHHPSFRSPVRRLSSRVVDPSAVRVTPAGSKETPDFRLFFEESGKKISPWHNIPMAANGARGTFNFVNEIAQYTRPKMEVATKEEFNPIKQDVKKDKLRLYGIDPTFNYGCLPRTFEDPTVKHEETGCLGDADPIDVVEVGDGPLAFGEIVEVKPIGILCLIDEGEVDWKVIAIRTSDPKASAVDSVADLEKVMPGKISEVREWFRTYKTYDGKPLNEFGLAEECRDRDFTLQIIEETNKQYEDLLAGRAENVKKLWIGA